FCQRLPRALPTRRSSDLPRDLINSRDSTGHTPLMYAIGTPTDNVELVDALINAGASDDRGHMLMYAAAKGHTKTAERLIAAGARSEEHTSELQSRENLVC